MKVEKVSGRLQNTIIHKPDEFLKTPAYDRNYPPIK